MVASVPQYYQDKMNSNSALSSALGIFGGGLGSLFGGGGENPADSAMPYFNQVPDVLKQYFNPYIQSGQGAMSQLQTQYGNLLNDPGGIYNRIGNNYKQSPGFQFALHQGLESANNAAAAGGMIGSPQHQQQAASLADNLASQDFHNYMQDALGLYSQGLHGTEGINQMGYGASSELGNSLANNLMTQGNLAYAGQINQNQSQGGALGSLLGGALSAIPFIPGL